MIHEKSFHLPAERGCEILCITPEKSAEHRKIGWSGLWPPWPGPYDCLLQSGHRVAFTRGLPSQAVETVKDQDVRGNYFSLNTSNRNECTVRNNTYSKARTISVDCRRYGPVTAWRICLRCRAMGSTQGHEESCPYSSECPGGWKAGHYCYHPDLKVLFAVLTKNE